MLNSSNCTHSSETVVRFRFLYMYTFLISLFSNYHIATFLLILFLPALLVHEQSAWHLFHWFYVYNYNMDKPVSWIIQQLCYFNLESIKTVLFSQWIILPNTYIVIIKFLQSYYKSYNELWNLKLSTKVRTFHLSQRPDEWFACGICGIF